METQPPPEDRGPSFEFPAAPAAREGRSSRTYILLGGAAALALVAMLIVATRPRSLSPDRRVTLTDEEKAYLGKIAVADVRMSAADNFLGHTVTMLDAHLTNQGEREVRHIELELEFLDVLGQVILRERANPLAPRMIPLKPRETRPFQISFDRMPAEWNQAPPRVRVVLLQF